MRSNNINKVIGSLVIILLVPFLIISVYAYLYIEFSSEKEFKDTMSRFTANAAKANIEAPLNEIKLIFRSLSASIDKDEIDNYLDDKDTDLNTVIPTITDSTIFFSDVIISDANDKYKTYPATAAGDTFPRLRPWRPQTTAKDVILYSDPYVSNADNGHGMPALKKKSVTASMNLFNKGSAVVGNIAFDLDLKSISSNINNKTPPFHGRFLITSSSGEVVLSENKSEILRKTLPVAWIEQAVNVEGDFYDDKENVYVFYKTYMNPDWYAFTVVHKKDHDEITNVAKQTFWMVLSSCIVFYMFIIFLAKMYMDQIISRLYMGINGIDLKKEKMTMVSIYENIKKDKENLSKAIHDSTTDVLTNIFNRRKFDDDMHALTQSGTGFYLAIIDIDNFKKINDTYGHDVGDYVLRTVSKIGCQVVGPEHRIYRFGGEELCVIYVGDEFDDFFQLTDTWLHMVSIRKWREPGLHVTFSGGIVKYSKGQSIEDVLRQADTKLYEAKTTGKNRILA